MFSKRIKDRNNNNLFSSSRAGTLVIESIKNEEPENNENANNIHNENTNNKDNENTNDKHTIQNIKHNKCLLYFCCICYSMRKNKEQIIIKKGMDMVKENLDIIPIFKNMYRENKQVKVKEDNLPSVNMSIILKKEENEKEKEKEL